MRGILFTYFTDFVAEHHGEAMVDRLIDQTDPASGGAYTSVGDYPTAELAAMVTLLARHRDCSSEALLLAYGRYVFDRFLVDHADYFAAVSDTPALLRSVEAHIHREVMKLYPDSRPPRFRPADDPGVFAYHSHRPLEAVAEGLIQRAIEYFHDPLVVERHDAPGPDQRRALFHLRAVEPAE
ncbi:MAG: heme NO-binding domain-containing protein [Rhodothalassiaceae bacterium]